MLLKTICSTFLAVLFMLFSISGASAEDSMSDANKKEVEAVVEDYILKNPEILLRAIQTYQAKIQAEKRQQAKETYPT